MRSRSDARERWTARSVTYGAVALLLVAGVTGLEAWPVSSFHLFSSVRTDTSRPLELVAVHDDGTRTPVRLAADNPVLRTTAHQYRDLVTASADDRRAMATAWLRAADLDPGTVTSVRLERLTRVMEPSGAADWAWRETARELVTEVDL